MGTSNKKAKMSLLKKGAWAAVAAAFGITFIALGTPRVLFQPQTIEVSRDTPRSFEADLKTALSRMEASSTSSLSPSELAEALRKLTPPAKSGAAQ